MGDIHELSSCTTESKCNLQRCHTVLQFCLTTSTLVPQTSQAFTFHPGTFLNLHYLTYKPSAVSLILFPKKAEGITANPESGEDLLLHVGFKPVNQLHLLLAFSLHREELDDAGGLVDVDAHGGGQGELDVHILAVMPDLVTGARPASAPGPVVLSKATWSVLAFARCTLANHPDHHPAHKVHFPVPSLTQQTLLTQHLEHKQTPRVNVWKQFRLCSVLRLYLWGMLVSLGPGGIRTHCVWRTRHFRRFLWNP